MWVPQTFKIFLIYLIVVFNKMWFWNSSFLRIKKARQNKKCVQVFSKIISKRKKGSLSIGNNNHRERIFTEQVCVCSLTNFAFQKYCIEKSIRINMNEFFSYSKYKIFQQGFNIINTNFGGFLSVLEFFLHTHFYQKFQKGS